MLLNVEWAVLRLINRLLDVHLLKVLLITALQVVR